MISIQIKVWRDYAPAFEKFLDGHREFQLVHIDATNRHSLYYVATVKAPFQWDLFNALWDYGPIIDHSVAPHTMHDLRYEFGYKTEETVATPLKEPNYFELECRDKEVAEMVNEILLDRHFESSICKRIKTRVCLIAANGYEGLDQAKSYLEGFGLKLRKLRNKNVWLVKGAL